MSTQAATAAWMGYPDADAMNGDHDALHASLCAWLGVESYSLKQARGEPMTTIEYALAAYEEDAVLNLQRFIQQMRLTNNVTNAM